MKYDFLRSPLPSNPIDFFNLVQFMFIYIYILAKCLYTSLGDDDDQLANTSSSITKLFYISIIYIDIYIKEKRKKKGDVRRCVYWIGVKSKKKKAERQIGWINIPLDAHFFHPIYPIVFTQGKNTIFKNI